MKYFVLFVQKKIMALYHPPKMITNNAAPILSSGLAYEVNGKCGATRVLENVDDGNVFDATEEGTNNAWKVVFLHKTVVTEFRANNISDADCDKIIGKTYEVGAEIMADITNLTIIAGGDHGLAILYIDCEQS